MIKLRIRTVLMLLVLLLLSGTLSGCNIADLDYLLGNTQNTEPNAIPGQLQIIYHVYNETYLDDNDGTVVLQTKIIYPQIKNVNNSDEIDAINRFLAEQKKEYRSEIAKTGFNYADKDKSAAAASGYDFVPHSYTQIPHVKYNGNQYLSVVYEQTEDTGGARPMIFYVGSSYSVKTATQLELTDLLGPKAVKTAYTKARQEIAMTAGTDRFVYYDSYKEDVKNLFSANDFYLSGRGLTVFYQPSTIAPFSEGAPSFTLSYYDFRMRVYVPKLPSSDIPDALDKVYSEAVGQIDQNRALFSAKHPGIEWSDYSFEITDVTDDTATLILYFTVNTTEGARKKVVFASLRMDDDGWLLG